ANKVWRCHWYVMVKWTH
ncbi:helicase domain protein, partial [Vibrio parahaemolyticus V-223/04]